MSISSQQGWVLISFILGLLFVTASFAEETAAKYDFRVAWLKQHAIRLRSIDPNDEDFTDLEPLAKVLGDVRIVQLGEQWHGVGATFHAKTRLIKFLHQKLDFDVLAFESGLYACRKAWELLRGGMEPYKAFSHGVFGIWAQSEQVRPLIDYWGRVAKSDQPLELCGFDCQLTGLASHRFLVKDVKDLWDKLGTASTDASQRAAILEILQKLAKWHKPNQEELQQWYNALAAWRQALKNAHPSDTLMETELAFWQQFASSTSTLAAMRDKTKMVEGGNLRDPQMARNLIWLAQTAYPQRKIIVWASSPHLTHNPPPDWDTAMGQEVWKVLGKQTYSVGFIAAEGEWHMWTIHKKARKVKPPAPGSLEDLFVRAGFENAFVDFRSLGPDGAWLKEKLVARPFGSNNWEANWTDMFDGIVFIKKIFANTRRSKN